MLHGTDLKILRDLKITQLYLVKTTLYILSNTLIKALIKFFQSSSYKSNFFSWPGGKKNHSCRREMMIREMQNILNECSLNR